MAFLTAELSHYEVFSGETYGDSVQCTVDIKGDIMLPQPKHLTQHLCATNKGGFNYPMALPGDAGPLHLGYLPKIAPKTNPCYCVFIQHPVGLQTLLPN